MPDMSRGSGLSSTKVVDGLSVKSPFSRTSAPKLYGLSVKSPFSRTSSKE